MNDNLATRLGAVAVADEVWISNPVTGDFETLPAGYDIDPSKFFDPKNGWQPLLAKLQNVTMVGIDDRGGERYHITGTARGAGQRHHRRAREGPRRHRRLLDPSRHLSRDGGRVHDDDRRRHTPIGRSSSTTTATRSRSSLRRMSARRQISQARPAAMIDLAPAPTHTRRRPSPARDPRCRRLQRVRRRRRPHGRGDNAAPDHRRPRARTCPTDSTTRPGSSMPT